MVRPEFDEYENENAVFRDAARTLSFVRDAHVLIQTYDEFFDAYTDQFTRSAPVSVRQQLAIRQKEIYRTGRVVQKLKEFRETMIEAQQRVYSWDLNKHSFDAISGGLAMTYKRARKAAATAHTDRTTKAFHDFRKHIKYHWYHARLLEPIWPQLMKAHCNAAGQLGEILGDHHNMAVFRQTLTEAPLLFGTPEDVETLIGLTKRRQAELEVEVWALSGKLLIESSKPFTQRWGAYWNVWRG